MSETCPDCGAEIPADAPEGLCRNCLMRIGFDDEGSAPEESHLAPLAAGAAEPGVTGTVTYHSFVPQFASDRYTAERFHARGGMGEVWLARDGQIGRVVALKRLRKNGKANEERFLAEAQITGQLEHPGVVPVHDVGMDEDGQSYYVMKFVQGRTLEDAIDEFHAGDGASAREVDRRRLLEAFLDLCDAVAYAHSRGVVHRDIKPDNVMLGPYGETLVLDWGLAKVLAQPEIPGTPLSSVTLTSSDRSTGTRAGSVMGTPAYMPPELADGHGSEVGTPCDVYLLGATLYHILTGQAPRKGSSHEEMIEMARKVPPVPPRQRDKRVSRALEAICLKAMSKRPADRYATPAELGNEIRKYLAGEPVLAYPEPLPMRTWRWAKRHRRSLAWGTVTAGFIGMVIFGSTKIRDAERERQVAVQQTQQLQSQQGARQEISKFRSLHDEAFFRSGYDAPDEQFAYYDTAASLTAIEQALSVAEKWGESLASLPLNQEREPLQRELYDLWLLKVNVASMQRATVDTSQAQQMLADLQQASLLREEPTRGLYRLRAECYRLLGDRSQAESDEQLSSNVNTEATALDHFLHGEQYRTAQVEPDPANPLATAARQDLEPAIAEYRTALRLDPNHFWSRFQLGRCYLSVGQLPAAVEALGACVAQRPQSPWPYSARAIALARQKRFDEALADVDRALTLQKDFHPARLDRGWIYWRQGEEYKAIQDFSDVLASPDKKRLIHAAYYLGHLYFQQDDYPQALKYFQLFTEESTSFRPVYRDLAKVHYLLGNGADALASLNKYLELTAGDFFDVDSAETHLHRGMFSRQLATSTLAEQLAKANNEARVYRTAWVAANIDNNDLPQAIKQVLADSAPELTNAQRRIVNRHLVAVDSKFKQTASAVAAARAARRRILELALAELTAAEPDLASAELYYNKGIALGELGRIEDSRDTYSKGLTLDPDNLKLLNVRGSIFVLLGEYERARTDYARAARAQPEEARDNVLLAEARTWCGYLAARAQKGRVAEREAARALLLLSDVNPAEKEVYVVLHNMACIYGELAKWDQAQRTVLEDEALTYLARAVTVSAKYGEAETELTMIAREEAFGSALRGRQEFKDVSSRTSK